MRLYIFEQFTGDSQVPVIVIIAEDENSAKAIMKSTAQYPHPMPWDDWNVEESIEVSTSETPRILYSNYLY